MTTGVPTLAFNLTPAPLRASPDILAEYDAIAGREVEETRLAPRVAMAIEDALSQAGWPVGRVCGPEAVLADNFDVSVRVMRQAFRILELRGACRPRRGASGGLIVLAPDRTTIAAAMANHLRWTGVSDDEIWAARDFIEPLAAASAARASGREEATAHPSVAALASPFLGLSLACLDQFDGGLSSAPAELTRAMGAAVEAGACEQAFDLARESVRARRRSNGPMVSPSAPSFSGAGVGLNLAASVAARIGAEIRPEACRSRDRLGSVWTLSERYGVSPGVMIEAVRLLEDAGVAESVKGRGGGVRLRLPDAAAIITTVHGYLAARDAASEAELCFQLNTWSAERSADMRSNADVAAFDLLWRLIEAAPEPTVMRTWYAMQRRMYEIAGNQPLHLLAVCFADFTVRNKAPMRRPSDPGFIGGIREAGRTIFRGVAERDGRLARQGHDRARAILIPGPARLLRA